MAYIASADVADVPGRLQNLWSAIAVPRQVIWLDRATAEVDKILGLKGGILTQAGVSHSVSIDRGTDTLFVPNKPITAINSITVQPQSGASYTLPVLSGNLRIVGNSIIYITEQNYVPYFDRGVWPFVEDDYVTINYDCGYATVPSDVEEATLEVLSSKLFAIADNPGGAESIGERGAHISFGSKGGEVNAMTGDAERLLAPYRITVMH